MGGVKNFWFSKYIMSASSYLKNYQHSLKTRRERFFQKGYVHFYQKVGATTTNFGDKMTLEGVKGCQWILV